MTIAPTSPLTSPATLFISLALTTSRKLQSAFHTYDGVVTSSSIAAGRATFDSFINHITSSRTITIPPRHNHSFVPYFEASKCFAYRTAAGWIPVTETKEI